MSDLFDEPDHATPLTPEERRELIPAHIAYRSELNEAELEVCANHLDACLFCEQEAQTLEAVTDRVEIALPAGVRFSRGDMQSMLCV